MDSVDEDPHACVRASPASIAEYLLERKRKMMQTFHDSRHFTVRVEIGSE
jgi:hypothetical protein